MDNENQIMNQHFPGENRQPQQEQKWFWKDGLSIDETKMSTLIICLLVCMTFGGANYIIHGDITNNLTSIIQALIYAIAGVNIGNGLLNRFGGNSYSNYPTSNMNQNMMGSNMMNSGMPTSSMTGIREAESPVIPPGVTTMPTGSTQNTKIPEKK